MNDRIKEVRATLEQVRASLPTSGLGLKDTTDSAVERLTNAIDVLAGEVERLDISNNELIDAMKVSSAGELLLQKHALKLGAFVSLLAAHVGFKKSI